MATSGTAVWNPSLIEIMEEAFDRINRPFSVGYDITTARRSLNYLFAEWANRGINMWTLESGTQLLTAGTATYSLPADTVDIMDVTIRTNSGQIDSQSDISITRISFDTYQTLPNKLTTGRPTQYMITRGTAVPTIYLWTVPDTSQTYYLYYWRLRRIQDAGASAAYTADVPFRFLPALTSGLAYHLGSKKRTDDPNLVAELKARYDLDWEYASNEDHERASWNIVPYVGQV